MHRGTGLDRAYMIVPAPAWLARQIPWPQQYSRPTKLGWGSRLQCTCIICIQGHEWVCASPAMPYPLPLLIAHRGPLHCASACVSQAIHDRPPLIQAHLNQSTEARASMGCGQLVVDSSGHTAGGAAATQAVNARLCISYICYPSAENAHG
jgi:hypothetical protein